MIEVLPTMGTFASGIEPRTTRQKVDRRPPSTFWQKKYKDQTFSEKLCNLATCPPELHELKDETLDRGPIEAHSVLEDNLFIFSAGVVPILVQAASYHFFPNYKWPASVAYPFYFLCFNAFAIASLKRMVYYCTKLGTFDEKNIGRDRTPDKATGKLAQGVILYMFLRTALPFYLYYNKNENPLSGFTPYFPLRMAAWHLALDYFFYAYHRSCHQFDFLWGIHQKHHSTKHPTVILAMLADDIQECLEIILIPLAATTLVREFTALTFAELYIIMTYTIYIEMLGHSGVRSYWRQPVLFWLRPFGMEGAVEDHDLHHQYGRSGMNYGKQSRVWDRLFGTITERVETAGF